MRKSKLVILAAIATIAFYACQEDIPIVGEDVKFDETPYTLNLINNTLPPPSIPEDNKLTVQKVKLGKMLFFEKKMSLDNTVSCGSCHNQQDAFSDTLRFSEGVNKAKGGRQAMAIFNMAWHGNQFFWDGRANLLRDQALLPIQDENEMKETLEGVIAKLNSEETYKNQFIRAFGSSEITSLKISLALENYMHSIVSDDSKYDRYLAETAQLTESEERGRVLFFSEYNKFFPDESGADCAHCHSGNNFENDLYMNNGLDADAEMRDFGRELATKKEDDRGKFKVPSLRNVEMTPPYMHDGRFQTLEEVVDHYNEGIKESTTVDGGLLGTNETGLMLDEQEKKDLVNFLKTLTDQTFLNNQEYQL
ncbi:MAG: cytochrome c peroxidase [Sphingobacteriales bacterium]|jgi:cytochrome c peroxidase